MPGRNFTDAEEEQIAKIYLAGYSARAIARAYGLRFHISIVDALRRQGVTQRLPPERNRLYTLDPHMFDVIDNEAVAYWWGFVYADGCVCRRSLNVTAKRTDASHLYLLRAFMKSQSPVHFFTVSNGTIKEYPQARIEFTDRDLAARLRELGITPHRENFHLVLLNLPQQLIRHWVRGFFDGDGSAHKAKALSFCGRPELLLWIRSVMAENAKTNPDLAVSKHTISSIYYLQFGGLYQALRVADFMYHNATVYLERKRKVIESWPTPQRKETKRTRPVLSG